MKNQHGDEVVEQVRLSLPNAAGALSTVTKAVSSAGGVVGEVHTLRNHTPRRVVQLDSLATSERQWAAIRQALLTLAQVQVEAETDPTLDAHRGGLIGVQSRVPFRTEEDFSTFYTVGALRTARTLAQPLHLVSLYTATSRVVALVTNGENIPGLGEVAPRAAMPLLEGQAVLLNTMLLLSCVPILLDTRDPHETVRTLVHIAPTFAAIVLEGIAVPGCHAVEEALSTQAAEAQYVADDQRLTTALVFPGIIRGALDVCSTRITDAMKIAAAVAIMRHCRGTDLLPSVLDPAPHLHVAHAVQDCATREQTEPERGKGP